ncbi:uncharacterized protein DSM5745_09003 [Aspergillus mulundensis]|uniref:DNA2/NAM7 helicase-like C-terminal domain-containing protein n=1 Tax=Aspergillus mulundensis TaxID=1810919 RepID=A0A3D8QZD7_9EURO|nr:hypothetical protein DSM5745_09003 [Aspergillus mulundensis]RDW67137.1 hypothetical protein DSM5745_09003 [Aspergillus mulundensis]
MGNLPSDDQRDLSSGKIKLDEVESWKRKEVDWFEELRKAMKKMKTTFFSERENDDKSLALIAFREAGYCLVVSQSRALISTNNNLASTICSRHFAQKTKGVLLIRDEDPKELEHEPGWNEFSPQLETSFASRMVSAHHPVQVLGQQRRCRPIFTEFPKLRTYGDKMHSHLSTLGISVNPSWEKMVRDEFDATPELDTGCFVLSIKNSSCEVDDASKSKFNAANMRAIVTLCVRKYEAGGYRGNEMRIITMYAAQRDLYKRAFFEVRHRLPEAAVPAIEILPEGVIPSIETADSMQGREGKCVIVDYVISAAKTAKDLGFVNDDNRCNVAHTRMNEVMVVVVPSQVGDNAVKIAFLEEHIDDDADSIENNDTAAENTGATGNWTSDDADANKDAATGNGNSTQEEPKIDDSESMWGPEPDARKSDEKKREEEKSEE